MNEHRAFHLRAPGLALVAGLLASSALSAPAPVATQTVKAPESQKEEGRRTFVWKSAGSGYLGVQVLGLTPELRRHFGVPEDVGVMVAKVEEKGPAAAAGVEVGDIVTRVDGDPVSDPLGLARTVRRKQAGELVPLELYRNGATVEVMVSVERRERPVVDLAGMQFLPRIADLPDLEPLEGGPGHGFVFVGPGLDEDSVKAFEDAMRGIEGRFESKDWQDKLEKLRELDLSKIQERMKEVEERLKKLEKELQQESLDKQKL